MLYRLQRYSLTLNDFVESFPKLTLIFTKFTSVTTTITRLCIQKDVYIVEFSTVLISAFDPLTDALAFLVDWSTTI